jgi:hypothetical protein
MADAKAAVLQQIDAAIDHWNEVRVRAKYADFSDLHEQDIAELVAVLASTIERFAPEGSTYRHSLNQLGNIYGQGYMHNFHQALLGILRALRRAYASGYLTTVKELVHASVFTDFFGMAEYLLSEGYKDPAAVIAGSVLEENIRNLCIKHTIDITDAKGNAKKASMMNDDLMKAAVYTRLEHKSVTAWLNLRNDAAHGHFSNYDAKQVKLYMQGILDFITRYPA